MKKVIVFFILILSFSFPIRAESVYSTQYDNVEAESVKDGIDKETLDFLNENNIFLCTCFLF